MPKTALSAKERLRLVERVYVDKFSVTKACREFGVSRFTFYKWAKFYNPALTTRKRLKELRDKKVTRKSANRVPKYIESTIKETAALYPDLSKYKLTEKVNNKLKKGMVCTQFTMFCVEPRCKQPRCEENMESCCLVLGAESWLRGRD